MWRQIESVPVGLLYIKYKLRLVIAYKECRKDECEFVVTGNKTCNTSEIVWCRCELFTIISLMQSGNTSNMAKLLKVNLCASSCLSSYHESFMFRGTG